MLISSKTKELLKKIQLILNHPKYYNLTVDCQHRVSIQEIFETLLTDEEWFWINIYDVERILEETDQCVANTVTLQGNESSSWQLENQITFAEQLFLPMPVVVTESSPCKLYETLKVAFLISGHRVNDFEQALVKEFNTAELLANGVTLKNYGTHIHATSHPFPSHWGTEVSKERLDNLRTQFYLDLGLSELLYIDDEGYQSRACRYLYKQLPQIEVEKRLVTYLNHPDANIRAHACLGLSFPVNSASVSLDQPMPSWDSLTEPATLSPDTLRQLLNMLVAETDSYVLFNAIGLLKAQNYTGKLSGMAGEVKTVLLNLLPRLEGQLIEESKQLIVNLSLPTWKPNPVSVPKTEVRSLWLRLQSLGHGLLNH